MGRNLSGYAGEAKLICVFDSFPFCQRRVELRGSPGSWWFFWWVFSIQEGFMYRRSWNWIMLYKISGDFEFIFLYSSWFHTLYSHSHSLYDWKGNHGNLLLSPQVVTFGISLCTWHIERAKNDLGNAGRWWWSLVGKIGPWLGDPRASQHNRCYRMVPCANLQLPPEVDKCELNLTDCQGGWGRKLISAR